MNKLLSHFLDVIPVNLPHVVYYRIEEPDYKVFTKRFYKRANAKKFLEKKKLQGCRGYQTSWNIDIFRRLYNYSHDNGVKSIKYDKAMDALKETRKQLINTDVLKD